MIYDSKQSKVHITAIHIDKSLLIIQHKWISLDFMKKCKCFNNFKSTINYLSIGNPEHDENN